MLYYFLFITLKNILKALKDILQHFKFVNWWIRGFVLLLSQTGYLFIFKMGFLGITGADKLQFDNICSHIFNTILSM